MTDQREELERIINSPNFDLMFKNDKIVKDLAQTILDAGYVKKDSIELDEELIKDELRVGLLNDRLVNHFQNSCSFCISWEDLINGIAYTIAQAGKEIIK